MRLQTKIWLGTSVVIATIMALDALMGYRAMETKIRDDLDEHARVVRAMLMATRRVYHQQFIDSGIPLDASTLGFLPAHALSRISDDFPNWTDSRLSFNNVSDRARYAHNQADADELAAMDWFRRNRAAPDHVSVIRDAQGAELYHFTAPIWIEAYCLKCHGTRAAAPPTIRDAYAGGYDYKLGELRGVMSIKLPMADLRQRTLLAWGHSYSIRAGGYVILLLLLGAMLTQLVTRRLKRLETTVRRMESGDHAARVEFSGNDEVAALASGFNDMAAAIEKHVADVARLNHIYAALSETNQTIVRVDDEAELLQRVCRIAVEYGGVKLAWIGRADGGGTRLAVAAWFGSGQQYLHDIRIDLTPETEEGRGPTGKAWRTNQPVIVQDFFADASTRPWHERARPYAWGSSAAFPITRGGKLHMVLTLYLAETHAFDAKIVALLTEMASDIGYAFDRIDLVKEQSRLNLAVRQSEEKYRNVVTTSQDGFWLADPHGRLLEVNDAYVRFSGYSREQLLALTIQDLDAAESPEEVAKHLESVISTGSGLFETRHRTSSGQIKAVEVSTSYSPEHGGRFAAFIRDLTLRIEAEARINRLAHFDALTGLPNRILFADRFAQALGYAQRNQESLAVIFLDLDHFKNINDTLGHRVGDQLLVELTSRFQYTLRAEDTISRLGGDEFTLLLPHTDAASAARVARKLLQEVARPLRIEAHELVITPSIGVAIYPADGTDLETLLRKSDTATNWAKQEGRNTYRFFAPEMQSRSARILMLETSLRKALERDEMHLNYQPQINLQSGAVVGVEALLRWRHPEHGLISPAEFIPIAESSGLILPIGEWVLQTALRQAKAWLDEGLMVGLVAVNLSAIQFRQPDLLAVVERLLADSGLPPACLELELTESVAMADPLAAIAIMDALSAIGVQMSIDDFGTGYSSLNYLKRFRIDKLKIDQSFIRELSDHPEDEAIVQAIISLADTLKFNTIAEGVETAAQLEFLTAHGCKEVQGYFFSRPLSAEQLALWIRQRQAGAARPSL